MDDQKFDEKTALDWIGTIEDDVASIRNQQLYPFLKAWINHTNPTTILDIGAGQGICSAQIDLTNRVYVGLEPSPFLAARAEKKYGSAQRNFAIGSVYKMPFSDQSFDVAFSIATWHLFSNLKKAAEELFRVLKSNANFLIVTANPENYSLWTSSYSEKKQTGNKFEGTNLRPDGSKAVDVLYLYSSDEIKNSLFEAGLQVDTIEAFRNFIYINGRKLSN